MPEFHVLRISESGDLLGSNGCFRGLGRGYLEYESRVAGGSYTRPDRKTGREPKAIIPVHLYGMPAKMDEICAVAEKYGIPVLEDAAEALGSEYKGQKCGTFGKFGALSFNGNKMITTSGGGALIVPDEKAKKAAMFYATQAREPYPYYQHEKIGYNYRMSNICAGIGLGQMTVLEEHVAHHRHVHELYEQAFANVKGIELKSNPDRAV